MIKMLKKITIEKLIFVNIMIILIAMPLIILYNCYRQYLGINYFLNPAYLLWIEVPILFILYLLNFFINKKKIGITDILIFLLILLGALSTIFAVNVHKSIYGEYGRNEGLLSILSYYFIILNMKNVSNEKYKKIIIRTIIGVGVFHAVYGVLQVYTNFSFIARHRIKYMAAGLCGNPNFFGSCMAMLCSLTFSLYMLKEKKKYFVLSLLFFLGICIASSAGPYLSFILTIIFFTIVYRKKIKWKSLIKILLCFAMVYFLADRSLEYVQVNIFNNKIKTISSEFTNLNLSSLGNGRFEVWKDSLPLVQKYWLVGAGLDNFGEVFGFKNGYYYDKAHNVYLQIAVTNGIFALIIYLALLFIIFFKGFKLKDAIYISLFIAFTCYCIQAFANINVLEVTPIFYIICGLLLEKIEMKKKLIVS